MSDSGGRSGRPWRARDRLASWLQTHTRLWVPDFRASQALISVTGDLDPSAVSFVGPNERFLKVRGFDVGKVTRVYIPLQYEDDQTTASATTSDATVSFVEISRERDISPEDAIANRLDFGLVTEGGTGWPIKQAVDDLQAIYDHYLQQDDGDDGSSADSLSDSDTAKRFVQVTRQEICDQKSVLRQGGMTPFWTASAAVLLNQETAWWPSAAAATFSSSGQC